MSDEKVGDVHAALNWSERVNKVEQIGITDEDVATNLTRPTFLSVPEGRRVEDLTAKFDQWRDRPVRVSGSFDTNTIQSFIDVVTRQQLLETVLYLNRDGEELIAIINDHVDGSVPGFGDHRVQYEFPRSEEMQDWTDIQGGDGVTQDQLGVFLDDHLPEIVNPKDQEFPASVVEFLEDTGGRLATRSEMLQLSRDIQVDVSQMTATRFNLDSGEGGIQFAESHNTSSKGKRIKVPQMFLIAIPVFDAGDRFLIPMRLQYRVAGGQVKFFLSMWRQRQFVREAMDLEMEKVRTQLPDLLLVEGLAREASAVRP